MPSLLPSFWTYENLKKATGGQWKEISSSNMLNKPLGSLTFDSRIIKSNDIFIAIQGVAKNGHKYLSKAIENGAMAVIVDDITSLPSANRIPVLQVPNTQKALENLGVYARQHINAQRVAITGSVGKTSIKDFLFYTLNQQAPTWASMRSFNNLWGVPITLANMPVNTKYGICEIGTNHIGEINPLSKQVSPNIALITTVGIAHLGNFPSFDHLLAEKISVIRGLSSCGTVILPRDNSHFSKLSILALKKKAIKIFTFGYHKEANVRILKSTPTSKGLSLQFSINKLILKKEVPLYGQHWAHNIAAALAVGFLLGADIKSLLEAAKTFKEPEGRGRLHYPIVPTQPDKIFTLIDQTYNANPQSMRAALKALQDIPLKAAGKRIAVIGNMYELGNDKETHKQHESISEVLDPDKIQTIITVGKFAQALSNKIKNIYPETYHFNSTKESIVFLRNYVKADDLLMAKASKSALFSKIVKSFL